MSDFPDVNRQSRGCDGNRKTKGGCENAVLQLMVSQSKMKPAMVRKVDRWRTAIAKGMLKELTIWIYLNFRLQLATAAIKYFY
jgi:hypothetical protein